MAKEALRGGLVVKKLERKKLEGNMELELEESTPTLKPTERLNPSGPKSQRGFLYLDLEGLIGNGLGLQCRSKMKWIVIWSKRKAYEFLVTRLQGRKSRNWSKSIGIVITLDKSIWMFYGHEMPHTTKEQAPTIALFNLTELFIEEMISFEEPCIGQNLNWFLHKLERFTAEGCAAMVSTVQMVKSLEEVTVVFQLEGGFHVSSLEKLYLKDMQELQFNVTTVVENCTNMTMCFTVDVNNLMDARTQLSLHDEKNNARLSKIHEDHFLNLEDVKLNNCGVEEMFQLEGPSSSNYKPRTQMLLLNSF
ncbi:hypothetical protein J1N35_028278 [Gossypium stocksii]|uniref:Uncharacterized protein n=1 Tax=Gossypium stocksii TaxID=47602 RepID=A0A9D3ZQY8_9ROSI|nr:hypothetical protein J1N35_028278 [Gossypium stocksii]